MGLLTFSQTTLTQNKKYPIKMVIGKDTTICFELEQAKKIATDLAMAKEDAKLIIIYKEKITTFADLKKNLEEQVSNCEEREGVLQGKIDNLNTITNNKNQEIDIKDGTIKDQKKKIIKLKITNIIGYALAAVLPVVAILATKK